MGVPVGKIQQRVKELHEFNPMLGFRGCRLGLVYPEIMIPLVGFKKELDLQAEVVHRVAKEVMAAQKVKLTYSVGTMIEIPRAR